MNEFFQVVLRTSDVEAARVVYAAVLGEGARQIVKRHEHPTQAWTSAARSGVDVAWHVLNTSDVERAKANYRAMFGWQFKAPYALQAGRSSGRSRGLAARASRCATTRKAQRLRCATARRPRKRRSSAPHRLSVRACARAWRAVCTDPVSQLAARSGHSVPAHRRMGVRAVRGVPSAAQTQI